MGPSGQPSPNPALSWNTRLQHAAPGGPRLTAWSKSATVGCSLHGRHWNGRRGSTRPACWRTQPLYGAAVWEDTGPGGTRAAQRRHGHRPWASLAGWVQGLGTGFRVCHALLMWTMHITCSLNQQCIHILEFSILRRGDVRVLIAE